MARSNAMGVVLACALTGACAMLEGPGAAPSAPPPPGTALFDWFDYQGHDPIYDQVSAGPGEYLNPILAGYYPDPSITRVGEDYYLVNSTFSYFPGIPVFHSRDLVNWTQLGNAIDRPGQLDFKNLGMSRGVFAPAITYHSGRFYIANTCVDCGGNYIITATDPAGPWSDPVFVPQVGGIDPSLFFDDDGTLYLINNDAPAGPPRYSGHRAIWIRAIDPTTFQPISEPKVLVDGGVRPEQNPIWIEGPHIFKRGAYYYLMAAEGGTEEGHSEVILRAHAVLGPYEPYPGNPILTQRQLPNDRPNPITSTGHADLVATPDGNWWAVFLGTRPYLSEQNPEFNRVSAYYNIGRETFLMPVRWTDDWPVITANNETVPYVHARPALTPSPAPPVATSGNFSVLEDFNAAELAPYWIFARVPTERWYDLSSKPGALAIRARPDSIGGFAHPSFIARRQQHSFMSARTSMQFVPQADGDEAGLVAFQNDEFYYFIGVARENGATVVRLQKRAGRDDPADGVTLATAPLAGPPGAPIELRIDARGAQYDFYYALHHDQWTPLYQGADGKILSTREAGGFIGSVVGMYAHAAVATQ